MLYSFVFHCDFSNPNRITTQANRPASRAIFVLSPNVESSLSKERRQYKNAVLRSRTAICAPPLMTARGGRENGAQRRHPFRITQQFVRYLSDTGFINSPGMGFPIDYQ